MVAGGFRLVSALLVKMRANQVCIAQLQAVGNVAYERFCLIL